jgi:hypothetical protein
VSAALPEGGSGPIEVRRLAGRRPPYATSKSKLCKLPAKDADDALAKLKEWMRTSGWSNSS